MDKSVKEMAINFDFGLLLYSSQGNSKLFFQYTSEAGRHHRKKCSLDTIKAGYRKKEFVNDREHITF